MREEQKHKEGRKFFFHGTAVWTTRRAPIKTERVRKRQKDFKKELSISFWWCREADLWLLSAVRLSRCWIEVGNWEDFRALMAA
ncbi:hypothetical protein JZ751_003472 [Albula glossodonta]|uniref:Uncharacterized protein n=1 Tax=Albula glossodonta TaxID=121402 RepID=A0A8T2N699_9TELE|nr:hypothetical protein JZ751_003472 [Albula glossodonta]